MFFDIFKDLCDRKGISPKRAADDMGLSNSITTKWKKTGATPNGETLNRIAEYFGVTIDYLLSGKEKAPTQAGERKSDLDAAKIALFGGDTEVTDEMWDEAVLAAEIIKARYKRKKD